jgi:hypothetical protein
LLRSQARAFERKGILGAGRKLVSLISLMIRFGSHADRTVLSGGGT